MTKIAILGCGWLGLPLAKQLVNSGYSVNGSTTTAEKKVALTKANINAFVFNLEDFKNNNYNEFLNVDELVIMIPPRLKNHMEVIKNLIAQIEASSIKRVTYTSSISVYGNASGNITEKTETNPIRASVTQIIEIEQLLLNNTKFSSNIIRLGGLIGPNRHPAYHLLEKEIKAPKELINLIHLEDCISVIEQLLKTNISNDVFNLVNPYHPTKGDYYSYCCSHLKLPLPIMNNSQDPILKEISSKKIISVLNYQFKNNLILS